MRREFTLQLYDRTSPPDAIAILPFRTNSMSWVSLMPPRTVQPGERVLVEVTATDGPFQMRLTLDGAEVVHTTALAHPTRQSVKLSTRLSPLSSASAELTIQVRVMSITDPVCIHAFWIMLENT